MSTYLWRITIVYLKSVPDAKSEFSLYSILLFFVRKSVIFIKIDSHTILVISEN